MLALAIAGGCGKSEDKKAVTQVAAKVNSTEITVHQINAILARTPNIKPEVAERAKREILDRLIDQELAKQEAMAKKLDRSPNVVPALEAARSEILARAHLEQLVAALPKPKPEETKKYYGEHPELFAQRRVFNIEEIVVESTEGMSAALAAQVKKSRSMQEIAEWLKTRGAKFAANRGVRTAEQIPLESLPSLQEMKDGEIRVFEAAGGGQQVIRVVASRTVPVDEATAAPRIQQFLFAQRSREAIAKEMKQIKQKAKIEYMGEFAAGAAEAEAKAKAETEAKAKARAEAKAKAESETRAREEELAKARRAAEAKNKEEAEARAKEQESSRARRAAEAKAREAGSKAAQSKPAQPLTPEMEKGLRGVIR